MQKPLVCSISIHSRITVTQCSTPAVEGADEFIKLPHKCRSPKITPQWVYNYVS